MNGLFQGLLTVLARILISAIFLLSAVGDKIPNFAATEKSMQDVGIPMPQLMLVGAIFFLIFGSISVILGIQARIGATLLLIFIVLATYYYHGFWRLDGQAQQLQMIQFLKNLSIAGALLFIMANGAGPMSLDRRRAVARHPQAPRHA